MEILVNGAPLEEYRARGKTYVEALPGREYSIRLRNLTAERLGVALSVDGLNSIDARATGARDARKWILGPWQSITISGWQTSSGTARRFYFTTEEASYGAWLGKTRDLGVLSAAAFREKRVEHEIDRLAVGRDAPSAHSRSKGSAERSAGVASRESAPEPLDESAATGIGREVEHRVVRVPFEPEDRPTSVLNVRYEYRDALVALGVLPPPPSEDWETLARRERARGFRDPEFAPDPYR